MATEHDLQSKILKLIEYRGGYALNQPANSVLARGTSDVIACYRGRFLALEVKKDINGAYGLTGAQKIRLRQVGIAGGVAKAIDKLESVVAILDWLDQQG